jgi:hypothetical protein
MEEIDKYINQNSWVEFMFTFIPNIP